MVSGGDEEVLVVEVAGFSGPLDLLLDLARRQRVDLARIDMVELADRYLAWLEGARRRRLALAAEYLVTAAWLLYLKSRLLLPAAAVDAEAEAEAVGLRRRLAALDAARRAADWLRDRPWLGRERHPRGRPERLPMRRTGPLRVDLAELVRAWFALAARAERARVVTLVPRRPLSAEEALSWLARRLTGHDWRDLRAFLPPVAEDPLARRAALAATLVAGLELARRGEIELRQPRPFGPVLVRRRRRGERP